MTSGKNGRRSSTRAAPDPENSLQDMPGGAGRPGRTQDALRESEERYRTLFEGIPIGLYRVTPGGTLLDGNPALARMLGFSSVEAMKAEPMAGFYLDPRDRDRWRAELESRDRLTDYEIRHRRADGKIIWVRDNARVVRDEQGRVVYYEGSLQEVTEQKQATEQAQFHASLLDQVQSAVMATDMQGRVTYWNRFAETLYGWTRADALGQPVMRVVGQGEGGSTSQAIMAGAARSGFWEGEFHVRRKDGTTFPAFLYLHTVTRDGRPVGFVGVSNDITGRKDREQELRDTIGMLRAANENRGRLLARLILAEEEERRTIAGDIHDDSVQVMSAAVLRLGTLRKGLADKATEQEVERIETTVQLSILRLRHLMFELRPPDLDRGGLGQALSVYVEGFREAGGPTYEVDDRIGRRLDPQVQVVLYRIAQEALANVRKHAKASRVHILLEEHEGQARVRIEDDGIGYAPSDESQPLHGHLGLETMQERAELAGGSFRTESSPEGTTVEFGVPVAAIHTVGP